MAASRAAGVHGAARSRSVPSARAVTVSASARARGRCRCVPVGAQAQRPEAGGQQQAAQHEAGDAAGPCPSGQPVRRDLRTGTTRAGPAQAGQPGQQAVIRGRPPVPWPGRHSHGPTSPAGAAPRRKPGPGPRRAGPASRPAPGGAASGPPASRAGRRAGDGPAPAPAIPCSSGRQGASGRTGITAQPRPVRDQALRPRAVSSRAR
jgi:hypothetical protein